MMKTIKIVTSAPALALAAMFLLAGGIEAQEAKTAPKVPQARKAPSAPQARTAPDAPKTRSTPRRAPQVEFDPEQGKAGLGDSVKPPRPGDSYDRSVRHNIPVLQAAQRSQKRYVDREELYKRTLAMYEENVAFDSPLSRIDAPTSRRGSDVPASETPDEAVKVHRYEPGRDVVFPILLLAAVLATGWLLHLGATRSREGRRKHT
jgi:hypothetical protein